MPSSMSGCNRSLRRSTSSFSTTETMAMKPPKLVRPILIKIQNSEDKEAGGVIQHSM